MIIWRFKSVALGLLLARRLRMRCVPLLAVRGLNLSTHRLQIGE